MELKNKLVNEVIDITVDELRKDATQTMIKESVLDPLIRHVVEKLKPYIIASVTAIVILFLLLIILIYVILTSDLS